MIDVFAPTSRHLKGERSILRRVAAGDRDEFVLLAKDSEELHADWIRLPKTANEFDEYLARYDEETGVSTVVCRATTGEIAGFINISEIVRGPYLRATVGYGVFAPSEKQGYMTEGLKLAIQLAFDELGLHRLEADIQPGNLRSKQLVERVGFHREGLSPGFVLISGTWRDHERWAVTAG
jgi:ribosomal-protein-alanine N-acetyltransferase